MFKISPVCQRILCGIGDFLTTEKQFEPMNQKNTIIGMVVC